jgi:sulfonate transport system permease protein
VNAAAPIAGLAAGGWRGLVLPALLMATWAAVRHLGWGDAQIFVSPSAVWREFLGTLASGALPSAIGATTLRAFAGFVLGAGLGLIAGAGLALNGGARRLFSPTFNGAQPIALFAWIPLLSAWLGTGEIMKLALIALGAFFPMLLSAQAGCGGVPQSYLEVGRLLELAPSTRLFRIVLPAAAPALASGLEVAFATAWLGTVGTEYLVGSGYVNGLGDGIGGFLATAREYGRMDRVIVGILALALTGLFLDRVIVRLCGRLMPWRQC